MDNRQFESGASASPPSPPASPSAGYPTNGNPGTGTPATVPGEWWFHQIGEELRAVIAAAGLTPDHANLTQLLAAMNAGWGMAKSLTSLGYITLPGGLILQFGVSDNSSVNPRTITLPIAFPNEGLIVLASDLSGGYTPTTVTICSARFISASQIQTATASSSSTLGADSLQWLALGY
jgi:hypothetical protein